MFVPDASRRLTDFQISLTVQTAQLPSLPNEACIATASMLPASGRLNSKSPRAPAPEPFTGASPSFAWDRRLVICVNGADLEHLGHDPFETAGSPLLAVLPAATPLLEFPDGWYAPLSALYACGAMGQTDTPLALSPSAAKSSRLAALALLPPPLPLPPGYVPPAAVTSVMSPSGSASEEADAGRSEMGARSGSEAAAPSAGGARGAMGRDVAMLDIRRSFDGIRRIRDVETALRAELLALQEMRGGASAGIGGLVPVPAGSALETAPAAGRSSDAADAAELRALEAELEAAERDVALQRATTEAAEAAEERAEAELGREVRRLEGLRGALGSELAAAEAAGRVQRRSRREADIWEQLLQQRRELLVGELWGLYPVLLRDQLRNVYSIKGLLLTEKDVSKMEEENTSTALGYVAHATELLARYLHQPLRYELVPIASRSWVRDRVDPYTPRRYFPLFSKGQAKEDFLVAMKMLRRNVEQLLVSQGQLIPDSTPLLGKLRLLMMTLLGKGTESSGASATTPSATGGRQSIGGAGSAEPAGAASGWQLV